MARNAEAGSDAPDLGIPQEDPNVTIDLDQEEEDPGEDQRAAGDGPGTEEPRERTRDPKTGKWSQKKRERGAERREFDEWRKNRPNFEAQSKQMREDFQRQMQAMQMRLDNALRQPAPPQQQQQQQDPFTQKFADLDAQMEAELRLIEADPKRDYKRYNELRRQESRLAAQHAVWQDRQANAQRPQQQQQRNPYAGREPIIESEFPWTMNPANAELCKRAAAIKQYLVSVEERPDTLDTDREALTQAVARFGAQYGVSGPPAGPSERTRSMYAGPGQRTAPRRGSGGPRELTVPRALLNGSGLSPSALAAAMRED